MDQPLPFGASPAWWHQVLDGLAELGTDREDHVRVEMRGGPPRKGHPHRLRVIFGEAATGAGGRHHERAEMLGERTKRRSRFLATVHAVTGEDQGEAGGDEQPRGRIEGGRVGGTGCRAVRGGLEDRDVRLIDGLSEHIGRNLEEGRSGATGERGPERFPYELGDSASLLDRGRELRHRPKDFDLRPELEPTAAQGVHAAPHALRADREHRHALHRRAHESRHHVGDARAASGGNDRDMSRRSSPRVGHVHAGTLVPRPYDAHPRDFCAAQHAGLTDVRDREESLDTLGPQRSNEDFTAIDTRHVQDARDRPRARTGPMVPSTAASCGLQ